jgi:microcystin-dependent protein
MSDPFIAEIRIFPFDFLPTGWAWCDGQILPISQNTALFSLLGTFYGGDGKSTFALPDLQGRAPMFQGEGPGLSERFLGETDGEEAVTLLTTDIPAHNHAMRAATADPANATDVSAQASWSVSQNGAIYHNTPSAQMAPEAVAVNGGDLPHNNMQPYLTLYFAIALQGAFPRRPDEPPR